MARKYSVMGDSISTLRGCSAPENRWFYDPEDQCSTGVRDVPDTWWGKVIAHDGGELLSNAAFSGSMVQGWGFPAGCSKERARQLLGPEGEAPDVVLVYYGLNDYGWGTPEAQAAGGSFASPASFDSHMGSLLECPEIDAPMAPPGAVSQVDRSLYEDADPAGRVSPSAVEAFEDAYARMLGNIREAAPGAQVVCITIVPGQTKEGELYCYCLRGAHLDEYNDAIRRAAASAGATLADARALGLAYESNDAAHPTARGMEQLASMVEAALKEGCAPGGVPGAAKEPEGVGRPVDASLYDDPLRPDGWDIVTRRRS